MSTSQAAPASTKAVYEHYKRNYSTDGYPSTESQNDALPKTMKALYLTARDKPISVKNDYPTPQAGPGSAVIRVLATAVANYSIDVYSGERPYPLPVPFVPGAGSVGRVEAFGPDSTSLHHGQLVWFDITVRSRDGSAAALPDAGLSGFFAGATAGANRLMNGEWRDGTYAQYAKVPLENLYPLNEQRLLGPVSAGGLGYDTGRLATALMRLTIPFGGLDDVNVRAGETVIVAPASGPFGSGAVRVAIAMGAARVIAMGRNLSALESLSADFPPGRVVPCKIVNDPEADNAALTKALGGPDAKAEVYFDISPPEAEGSTHIATTIKKLAFGGRISLMGGIGGDVNLPYGAIMRQGLTVRGTWMYTAEQTRRLLALVEAGLLLLGDENGVRVTGRFKLEEIDEALKWARKNDGVRDFTVVEPWA